MQRGIRKNCVERLTRAVRRGVGQLKVELRIILSRQGYHLRRFVNSLHQRARLGDFVGEVAGSAAKIEDSLAGLWIEIVNQARPEARNIAVARIVRGGIPDVGH